MIGLRFWENSTGTLLFHTNKCYFHIKSNCSDLLYLYFFIIDLSHMLCTWPTVLIALHIYCHQKQHCFNVFFSMLAWIRQNLLRQIFYGFCQQLLSVPSEVTFSLRLNMFSHVAFVWRWHLFTINMQCQVKVTCIYTHLSIMGFFWVFIYLHLLIRYWLTWDYSRPWSRSCVVGLNPKSHGCKVSILAEHSCLTYI